MKVAGDASKPCLTKHWSQTIRSAVTNTSYNHSGTTGSSLTFTFLVEAKDCAKLNEQMSFNSVIPLAQLIVL